MPPGWENISDMWIGILGSTQVWCADGSEFEGTMDNLGAIGGPLLALALVSLSDCVAGDVDLP